MNKYNAIKQLELNRQEMNLSKESMEFILNICRAIKPERILEIGAFNGYSALNFSLVSKEVISLEVDEENFKLAEENLNKADCNNVKIIKGTALETIKTLNDKFDIILIDGRKSEYKNYLELSLKLLNKNGLIFVDNTISHKNRLKEFFDYLIKSNLYFKELNLGKGLMIISKDLSVYKGTKFYCNINT
ncbi:class I SAM-dependent methyltransferase [Candidatus Woesearchaeota archaeon]|nr:class I SAM-dependent methyltransferase [Candidatus Woesearchaeota archaeon]